MLPFTFFIACFLIIALAIGRNICSKKMSKQRSLTGVSGIVQFIELIKLTQQHRGMHSGLLNGKLEFKDKLHPLASSINNLYRNILLFEKSQSYPESLSAHYPFKQWQRLVNNDDIRSAESFQLHSAIIARQLDALWDMSDEFSLTSNYLQVIRESAQKLVKTLPELAEALGQVRALSVQVASKQELSSDKKLQLLFTLGKIEKHHQNLQSSLPTSAETQLNILIRKLKENIDNSELCYQCPDALFQEATQSINDIFDVINTGLQSLATQIKDN